MPRIVVRVLVICLVLAATPATAEAAFPGAAGKLAFSSNRDGNDEIYTSNPDGSGLSRLTTDTSGDYAPAWSPDGLSVAFTCFDSYLICVTNASGGGLRTIFEHGDGDVHDPSWSPDGSQVAFTIYQPWCPDPTECELHPDVAIVNADGSGFRTLVGHRPSDEYDPAWSPDGTKIAYVSGETIRTIRPDGSGDTSLGLVGQHPNWSPNAAKLVYDKGFTTVGREVMVANANGTGETRLTTNASSDTRPVWSPDGTRIAFDSNLDGDFDIYVMNADGTGRHAVTANGVLDWDPDWQPLPAAGYPRPRGAAFTYLPLVPAYRECTAPDRTHGPPLSFASCASPTQGSSQLTLGTPDSNGKPAKSTGFALFLTLLGDPATPADEADVHLQVSVSDVRTSADLDDYAGNLEVSPTLRITDRDNAPHPGGPGPGTVVDAPFPFAVPCGVTSDTTVGSTCAATTTADAVLAGAVRETQRTIWELDRLQVLDAAGDAFLVQGIFVP